MRIQFDAQGSPTPQPTQRQAIWRAYNGDTITFEGRFTLKNNVPINYDNCILTFVMRDQRFELEPIWTGSWRNGIELISPEHPGLCRVKIPDTISASLRRGSYIFSLLVVDKESGVRETRMEGMLEIDYAPTSPSHDIPYRTAESGL